MQHVDGRFNIGHLDHSERTVGLSNPDLPNTLFNGAHRPPIVRITTLLHLIELIPCLATSDSWKGSKIIQGACPELDGFGAFTHGLDLYNILY